MCQSLRTVRLVAFVEFALRYIGTLQEQWWDLGYEERAECKILLFPAGFSISPESKVYTPGISYIFRLADTEEGAETPSKSLLVDQVGENLHLVVAEAARWREIIGDQFKRAL